MDRSNQGNADRFGAGQPADRGHPSRARLQLRNLCRLLLRSIHGGIKEQAQAVGSLSGFMLGDGQ